MVASLGVASVFLFTAGHEFINKVVVTTIDTTTASLQVRGQSDLIITITFLHYEIITIEANMKTCNH